MAYIKKIFLSVLFFVVLLRGVSYSQITQPLSIKEIKVSIESNLEYESDSPGYFIIYRAYVVKYNYKEHIPYFTIHHLHTSDFVTNAKAKRLSNFYVDDINLGKKSATNADYSKSGYDRGHMVPAGDYDASQLLKNETFYLTNICPQLPNLNRGIWNRLEQEIRNYVQFIDTSAVIITGSIIDSNKTMKIGPSGVGVPNYFYKILYFPESQKMYAFLFSNEMKEYSSNLEDYQVTVRDIEIITKENFFDKLSIDLQNQLETTIFKF